MSIKIEDNVFIKIEENLKIDDEITVTGIKGTHKIIEKAKALIPSHTFFKILLGSDYGKWKIGDTIAVEDYRCNLVK